MSRLLFFCFALLLTTYSVTPASAQHAGPAAPLGFTADAAVERQRAAERMLDASINAENLRNWMRHMTSEAQYTGSPKSKANAEFVADLFREWGYDVEIEVFHVLFPTPRERVVELVAPERRQLVLEEPEIPGDASSANRTNKLPPFNAYSADGDVEAELVYVNQGLPADYEELARRGVSVEGKIVIARYGGSWRGIKPKVAFENGAIGCILYSDPRDDGYWQGDVYPDGPYRMGLGTQSGSVADMPVFPGDPLTPFVGAKEDTPRLSREEAPTLMQIPVLPISYDDALPLLAAIGGPVAPPSFRGALPITYHIGPGPARVRMNLSFNWDIVPAYNVIARLPGSEFPDEWVMRGNHRDAWVFGASDPISGTVAMLEEARAIGELARAGHRPKRTVIFASWDAEEPGLLGSTEWAEYHADELREKLVAYINTDGTGRGFLGAGGSHTLEPFINQIAADVPDPRAEGASLQDRQRARARLSDPQTPRSGDLPISPLGSGSDYTPFLQHLGIASLNLGFGGESGGGSYHSTYDTFEHYTRFIDPDFVYTATLPKVAGRATLRLANADVLPFRFRPFSERVAEYADEIQEMAESMRSDTRRHNELVREGVFAIAADPMEDLMLPETKPEVPYIAFAPLLNAIDALTDAAEAADRAVANAAQHPERLAELNRALYRTERAMTHESGLPRRPWFRHQIYAPGLYTGYGVKTLPGVREAIEERYWEEADREINRLSGTLRALAAELRAVAGR
jgi:N-acetylated-alpha-linked acidic dipeptidase